MIKKLKTYFEDYQLGQFLLSCDYTNLEGWKLYNEGLKLQPSAFKDILKVPQNIIDIKDKKLAIISPWDYVPEVDGIIHPELRYMMGSYQIIMIKPLADLLKFAPKSVKLIVDPQFVDLLKINYPMAEVLALPDKDNRDTLSSLVDGADYVMSVTQIGGFPELVRSFEYAKPHIKADAELVKYFKEKLTPLCQGRYPLAISWDASKVIGAVKGKGIRVDKFFNNLNRIKDKFAFVNVNFYSDPFDRGTTSYFAKQVARMGDIYINAYQDYELHGHTFRSAAVFSAIYEMGGASLSIANFLELVASSLGLPGIKPLNISDVFNYGLGRGFGEDSISRQPWTVPIMQSEEGEWDDVMNKAMDLFQNHYNPKNPLRFDHIPPYDFMTGKEKYYKKHYADRVKLSVRDISKHWK